MHEMKPTIRDSCQDYATEARSFQPQVGVWSIGAREHVFHRQLGKGNERRRDDMNWRDRYGVRVMNGRLHRDLQLHTYLPLNLFQDL